jgi:predicted DNA-binding transcriptional regulator AlpA
MESHQTTYLRAGAVRARYSVSDMSIWRWLRDEALGFPAPIRINRRHFWNLAALEAWEASRATKEVSNAASKS